MLPHSAHMGDPVCQGNLLKACLNEEISTITAGSGPDHDHVSIGIEIVKHVMDPDHGIDIYPKNSESSASDGDFFGDQGASEYLLTCGWCNICEVDATGGP